MLVSSKKAKQELVSIWLTSKDIKNASLENMFSIYLMVTACSLIQMPTLNPGFSHQLVSTASALYNILYLLSESREYLENTSAINISQVQLLFHEN